MFRTALRGIAALTVATAVTFGGITGAAAAPGPAEEPTVCSPLPTRCAGGDAPAGLTSWVVAMTNLLGAR